MEEHSNVGMSAVESAEKRAWNKGTVEVSERAF
jgi:hypothetical protein